MARTTCKGGIRFLPPKEVKQRLGIGNSQLNKFIHAGVLDAIDVSLPGSDKPRWHVSETSVHAFIAERQKRSPRAMREAAASA